MTRRTGLSLIELTITMLVIGILGAIGSIKYAEALGEHQAKALADTVRETLQAAKHGAQIRSTPVTVTFLKTWAPTPSPGCPIRHIPQSPI
jgi:prepilin-type N-terminal cleavage/methylation domain-containing protein